MKKRWGLIMGLVAAIVVILACLMSGSLRQKAQSANCRNQMIAIGYATRLWAEEHGGHLPPDLSSMSNEIIALKILICPGDVSRRLAESWSSLTTNNVSYRIGNAGTAFGTHTVFLRCPVHGFTLRADGTAYDGDKQLRKGLL